MKLQPQNAQQNKSKTKRERRKAPRYTLVWSQEVQALENFSATEINELRKKALWRIELAEAARAGAPAVLNMGGIARVDDIVWSKFPVGKYWFCLEFRPAPIREYHVTLASPPAPDDDTPPLGLEFRYGRLRAKPLPERQPPKKNGGSSRCSQVVQQKTPRAISMLIKLSQRQLARTWIKVRSNLSNILAAATDGYCNVSYNIRALSASLYKAARGVVSNLAGNSISITRMRDLPVWLASSEARLEPRCVGQDSGIHVLLYSWIRDEPQQVDWSADLFGISPSYWAANLFGVLPEEERVLV